MYNNKPTQFFSISQEIDEKLGDTLSFIWANYAGFRDMWWQVRGFKNAFPDTHVSKVNDKFFSGLPMPGGVDLNKMCLETEWQQHEQEYSKWMLLEACTMYEGWAEAICELVFTASSNKNKRKYIKALQFPSGTDSNANATGYPVAVAAANANLSNFVESQFFQQLKLAKLNKWQNINSFLTVYRYFKECRNGFIHSDGIVTDKIKDLHTQILTIQSSNSPFDKDYSLGSCNVGDKIMLSMSDCIKFNALVRNLIATFDAALCVQSSTESYIKSRVNDVLKSSGKWNLPSAQEKRLKKVHRILVAARLPEPKQIQTVHDWLVSENVI
ncbi:conserved hypothetical protein [Vibrio chagasii]|nr:conserved hypothetical protein [Vibrio chagasii]CAH7338129.1 conserved hypothetical protein [Vibrio chagasii]CAH7396273.1 conserved hypothetical protein [Vibrio chagasii]CAH7445956.1 conserved hypothetical protein [Vibrio chagasii]